MVIDFPTGTWFIITILIIWSAIWKAIALWKAVKNDDKAWFIALFILNTIGILEIFYIYVFSKRQPQMAEEKEEKKK